MAYLISGGAAAAAKASTRSLIESIMTSSTRRHQSWQWHGSVNNLASAYLMASAALAIARLSRSLAALFAPAITQHHLITYIADSLPASPASLTSSTLLPLLPRLTSPLPASASPLTSCLTLLTHLTPRHSCLLCWVLPPLLLTSPLLPLRRKRISI